MKFTTLFYSFFYKGVDRVQLACFKVFTEIYNANRWRVKNEKAMHHAFGIGLLVCLIAFAFGERTAQIIVGAVLALGALGFLAIVVLVVTGRI